MYIVALHITPLRRVERAGGTSVRLSIVERPASLSSPRLLPPAGRSLSLNQINRRGALDSATARREQTNGRVAKWPSAISYSRASLMCVHLRRSLYLRLLGGGHTSDYNGASRAPDETLARLAIDRLATHCDGALCSALPVNICSSLREIPVRVLLSA